MTLIIKVAKEATAREWGYAANFCSLLGLLLRDAARRGTQYILPLISSMGNLLVAGMHLVPCFNNWAAMLAGNRTLNREIWMFACHLGQSDRLMA